MAFRVLVFDKALGRKVYAYGEDRRELRFRSLEELAEKVHPQVGTDKQWRNVYLAEVAPRGEPAMVPLPEQAPRRFRRLADTDAPRRFKRLAR